jgi:endonuclease YncB( thermonuclease family)
VMAAGRKRDLSDADEVIEYAIGSMITVVRSRASLMATPYRSAISRSASPASMRPRPTRSALMPKGEKWACGVAARDQLVKHSADRAWDCDLVGADRYGRSLGKCFVENDDVSAWIVRSGWALSWSQRYCKVNVIADRSGTVVPLCEAIWDE